MVTVTVLYPNTRGSRFDRAYYFQKHIPLVKNRLTELGLQNLDVVRGVSAVAGGDPAFQVIALLSFSSIDKLNTALAQHGAEILDDIKNFTDLQPILQINEPLSS